MLLLPRFSNMKRIYKFVQLIYPTSAKQYFIVCRSNRRNLVLRHLFPCSPLFDKWRKSLKKLNWNWTHKPSRLQSDVTPLRHNCPPLQIYKHRKIIGTASNDSKVHNVIVFSRETFKIFYASKKYKCLWKNKKYFCGISDVTQILRTTKLEH